MALLHAFSCFDFQLRLLTFSISAAAAISRPTRGQKIGTTIIVHGFFSSVSF